MDQLPTHDSFAKRMLADIELVKDYLKIYLPKEMVEKLDFSTLTPLPESYLSDELKEYIVDRIFTCNIKGGKNEVNIAFLFEHKSHSEKYAPIQLGEYLFAYYRKQIQNKESLSIVIPVLLYHGKKKWEKQTLADLFSEDIDGWEQYIPDFDFIFNNIGKQPDGEIVSLDNRVLVASLLALKHIWDFDWLRENILWLTNLTAEERSGMQQAITFYIFGRHEFDAKVLNSLPEPVKTDVMNTFDVYYEKGIEKGIEEGIEKGIERGIEKGKEEMKKEIVRNLLNSQKFTVTEIANFAGVTESFVRRVASSNK